MKIILLTILCLICPLVAAVAQPVQTVRGVVTDRDTKIPLTGVTIVVNGTDPVIGTSTDINGEFILRRVPAGRQTLRFSYIGYETIFISEILIGSGRETVLDVGMKETIGGLDEVVVTPGIRKDIAMNNMAAASARLLSVEEASRYAGGFDDPARLASSFAGVAGNLANNAIVVRGNSPGGLLWRMEGIEIPAPAHFANLLTFGGGGITALSSHLLADSDFYTGAFPAEFGNALSGVFDMRLRNGNNSRREYTVKAGIMGLDAAAEGPFRVGGQASEPGSGSDAGFGLDLDSGFDSGLRLSSGPGTVTGSGMGTGKGTGMGTGTGSGMGSGTGTGIGTSTESETGLDSRVGSGSGSSSASATYLFNYRYSTFSLLGPLLPEDADAIRYQNLAFRVNLNTGRTGSVSLWGLGATDWSGQSADPDPSAWVYDQDREDLESPTRFGVLGLLIRQNLSQVAFLSTSFAVSGNAMRLAMDRYTDDGVLIPRERVRNSAGKAAWTSSLNYKISPAHIHVSGFTAGRLFYDQNIRFSELPENDLVTLINENGQAWQLQAFTQSSYSIGRVVLMAGIHMHYFSLNGELSPEPRAGLTIRTGDLSSLQLAYGRHSRIEHLPLYFANAGNRNLGFTIADHLVAGYRQLLAPGLNLNAEVYYQMLSDVPVISDSSFSVLNLEQDWFIRDRLVNDGKGRNYGLDVTLERYFSAGWYAMLSGSVFESSYRGGDGIWRDTRYNRNYTLVLLGGREWEWVSENRVRSLGVNGRVNLMGGRKYSPVDMPATIAAREVFYDETRAFSNREPGVVYADITIEYRINRRRTAGVWSLQLINLTGYREFYGYRYNLRTGGVDRHREAIVLPNLSYRFEF